MKKTLLFLSDYKSNALTSTYTCPGNSTVQGEQTNDAPVRYLLRKYRKMGEILCIVTPTAEQNAWNRFQEMVRAENPRVKCIMISFDESGDDFENGLLPQVLSHVQPGDEIYLETTGGMRNAVMYLLLISRALSYAGAVTAGAVYSNFGLKRVEDISHTVQLFDFIGGMQELASFGNVKNLRRYYERCWEDSQSDPKIVALLEAVEALWGSIALCRPREINARMSAFNRAMQEANDCSDPLMRALLPAFRRKFGESLTIPGLIRWCVESDMLQQALTVYKEQVPIFLLQPENGLLSVKENKPLKYEIPEYSSEEEVRFRKLFLKMSSLKYENGTWREKAIHTIEELGDLLYDSRCTFVAHCPAEALSQICMDYLYIQDLRNMTNHANESSNEADSSLAEYLYQKGYPRLNHITLEEIYTVLYNAVDHLETAQRTRRI